MKIVIAPDSFKESLTAKQVCQAIRTGMQRIWPDGEFIELPVADGGEGTVQSLVDATGGHIETLNVTGPLGHTVEGFYGILGDHHTAVIEIAAASGLHLVPMELRDPKHTTSIGTGELISHALDKGIRRFIIGLGGSATNDGGIGMLSALGATFLDKHNAPISLNGQGLATLNQITTTHLDARLAQCDILVACDVDNPLCGPHGATATFGPQKGASPADINQLDSALHHYASLIQATTGNEVLNAKGAGAAGGIGAALLGFLPVQLKPGIAIVLETLSLKEKLHGADLVITGEGRIDGQTVHGKTPMGVAMAAKQDNIPVIAIAGCTGQNYQAVYGCGIDAVFTCVPRAMTLPEAFAESAENLANVAENIARLWQLSHN